MPRYANWLFVFIAVVLIVVSVPARGDNGLWVFNVGPIVPLLLLAIASLTDAKRAISPRRRLVAALCIVAPVATAITLAVSQPSDSEWRQFGLGILIGAVAAALTYALLRRCEQPAQLASHAARAVVTVAAIAGAACIVASAFIKITGDGHLGWQVLALKAKWITDYASPAQNAFSTTQGRPLHRLYAPVGFVFYACSVIAAIGLVLLFAKAGFSATRVAVSRGLHKLVALLGICSLWIFTDLFWGWHFGLSEKLWTSLLGTFAWLATLAFGLALMAPVAHGNLDLRRWRTLLLLQIPLAAFNWLFAPTFVIDRWIYFPGLLLLLIGLQLELWVCMALIAHAAHSAQRSTAIAATA